ncbi:membrane protein [Bacillus coahuilensis m2-6]|uniref:hypothetical protein n=1 Tax=Bacillus coahuilensis TaxID=408580 RepID=UPI00075022BA|nr:hypothetical protein [Bacillus coahuilensis]KUP09557.1 membrane protein [Bacillus coahuilensis m2-6]
MRVRQNIFISALTLGLFAWAMVEMYDAFTQFAKVVKSSTPTFMIEINLIPLVAFIVIGGILSYISYSKKQNKFWSKSLLLPPELEETDEREKQITSLACRASYISMWYSFPIVTALLVLYPFIIDQVPYYPILLFLLLPLTQMISYLVSWKKNY